MKTRLFDGEICCHDDIQEEFRGWKERLKYTGFWVAHVSNQIKPTDLKVVKGDNYTDLKVVKGDNYTDQKMLFGSSVYNTKLSAPVLSKP
jgi:hypothetical protein